MQHRIKELQSQQETKHLVMELSSKITAHHSRVHQVLRSEPLRHAEVAWLVLVGMAADRPLESNFFPGLLEGLLGRLGIAMPGESKPPTSSHEGASCLWSSAVCEAVLQREHREVETPGTTGLPQCLNLNYGEDFLEKWSHQVPAAFSDPLFVPSMANAVYEAFKPPVLSRASPFMGGCQEPSTLGQPGDRDPEPEMPKPERPEPMGSDPRTSAPSTSQEPGSTGPSTSLASQQVQDPAPEASDTNSSKTGERTPEEERPRRGPKVKVTRQLWKHGHKAAAGDSQDGATPSKVRKEMEAEDANTPAPTGPSEAVLKAAPFELYDKDLPEVKEVHARILGLKEREAATQEDFDSSPDFQLRWAADETRQPKVISEHWINYLDREGHLAKCKPRDFEFGEEWLPLYTRASVTKQISGLSTLLSSQGDSPLIAVIPPDFPFQYEWEYVIHQLHKSECLSRMSVYFGKSQRKQIAFCPYCGVMNENSAMAYSHVRKHLGITFLCGGCYGKLYKVPQHLFTHIKSCHPCTMGRQDSSWTEGSHQGGKGKQ